MLLGVEQEDSLIIRKILLTHDPDGRCVDSWTLLQMIENVMCYAATTTCTVSQTMAEKLFRSSKKVAETHKDLWKTIHNVSCEVQLLDIAKV
ncbi:hypothetical protein MKW94_022227 [Papaver nudicaule]|uniref:Sieve element occlusion N-terminal domain-containing protein n=1 Tax=Papaver nudicaule TaxID=74823 RepID=A0AA41S7K9_PAPNU|nr:hypothetical protein [Papaver nudicaule]MCL7031641.1 hypothetical protein [Papaver nudicaule]